MYKCLLLIRTGTCPVKISYIKVLVLISGVHRIFLRSPGETASFPLPFSPPNLHTHMSKCHSILIIMINMINMINIFSPNNSDLHGNGVAKLQPPPVYASGVSINPQPGSSSCKDVSTVVFCNEIIP